MYCTVVVENDYQVYSSLRVFHTPCGSEPVPECQHDSSDTSHRAIISTSPRYHDGGAPIDGCQMVRCALGCRRIQQSSHRCHPS